MTRAALHGVPVAFALAGLLLLVAAALTGSGSAIAAAALLATLLIASIADPPVATRQPGRRAAGRLAAAIAALALGTVGVIAALAAGTGLNPDWPLVAILAGAAALVLVVPVAVVARADLDVPVRRVDRTMLLRGAGACAALAAGILIAAYVLPAVDLVVGVGLGLIAVLDGVALARPGGAGLRRLASEDELRAVESAVAHGPAEVAGHRRVVVRSTGGAEYLSVEVLLRPGVAPGRVPGVRDALEHAIKRALPDLVVSVRPVAAGADGPAQDDGGRVLPSAPWTER